MSAGAQKKTARVTGGSGYIASALIKMLLEKGYAVTTTARNPDDMAKNKDLQALGSLTVLRADLDVEGSFDDAVAGCDYAFLVAAPVNLTPQLQGDGHVLDEDSWYDVEYLTAHKPPTWGYCVSKVLVEKEACRFAQEKGINLVTVCPVITVGAAPAPNINTSVPNYLFLLSGAQVPLGVLKAIEKTSGSVPLVHVDDLCRAELFVAEEDAAAAAGRYNCCSLNTTVVELARFLAQKYPQYDVKRNLHTDDQLLEKPRACLSSAKLARKGFEFKHDTLDEIYDNIVEYGKALGILPN